VESLSLFAVRVLYRSSALVAERRDELGQQSAGEVIEDLRRPLMVHPYLGAVLQPDPKTAETEATAEAAEGKYRTTEYGFRDTRSPIRKRSPDRLIVAILGG